MSTGVGPQLRRRAFLGAIAAGAVSGCAPGLGGSGQQSPAPRRTPARITPPAESVAVGEAPELAAVAASRLYFASSPVVVLATTTGLADARRVAVRHHWPLLLADLTGRVPASGSPNPAGSAPNPTGSEASPTASAPPSDAAAKPVRAELARLGATTAVAVGGSAGEWRAYAGPGLKVVVAPAAAEKDGSSPSAESGAAGDPTTNWDVTLDKLVSGLPKGKPPATGMGFVLVADGDLSGAAAATAQAAGAVPYSQLAPDPRIHADLVKRLRAERDAPVVVIASSAQAGDVALRSAVMAQRAPELPGGGFVLFPYRRMVALYGHPGAPELGVLGEQGPEASVRRVQALAKEYAALVPEPVIPAFEIIATIASGGATDDGNYSIETPIEKLQPFVDAAGEAGMYAVLDLQPGRTDFLTQAKRYESLLARPHVGLALDPEWRLRPNERHLRQIGSVDAAEINTVIAWLAELVHTKQLPQKLLTLHQFQLRMIRNREDLDLSHPEIAVLVHADGQGSQAAKQDTWRALQQDLPKGVWLGWKNFYDEDQPMLTPAQTIAEAKPTPFFISYQ